MISNDSTKVTLSQVYLDLKEALNDAGEALKVGSEHVYKTLVLQQTVNSITLILISLVIFLAGGICLRYGLKDMRHEVRSFGETSMEVKDTNIALLIISGLALWIGVIHLSISLPEIITGFVNPEYGAIMEIKSFVR